MSILIKGMDMPSSCRKCKISQPDGCGWICPIIENKPIVDGRVNSRHPRCPLVPVPPHGRCIDADALEYGEAYLNGHYELGDFEIVTREDIESAPTIIPAEEGEG